MPLEEIKQGPAGTSSVVSSSVFDYTLSRSSALKDTPYQKQPRTAMAENDDYMMMKRMNVDNQPALQLRKADHRKTCTMCGQS